MDENLSRTEINAFLADMKTCQEKNAVSILSFKVFC